MLWRHRLLALALLGGFPGAAAAQPAAAAKQADVEFDDARTKMDRAEQLEKTDKTRAAELYVKALSLLRKSHAAEPGRGKLLNIAVCEERLGMLASALRDYRQVDSQLSKDDPRRALVSGALGRLSPRVPHVRIDLAAGSLAGASVTLDGAPLDASALASDLPVDPGAHVVTVSAAGRKERRYELSVEEGKRATLTVEASPPEGPTDESPRRRDNTVAFVLGGAGLAGLAVGGLFIGLREAKRSEAGAVRADILKDMGGCVPGSSNFDTGRCPALKGHIDTGDAFWAVSIAGFAAGGAAAAALGVYLLWPSPKTPPRSGLTVRLVPVLDGDRRGLAAAGTF